MKTKLLFSMLLCLFLMSCKITYVKNDIIGLLVETENSIPKNDTLILKSYDKLKSKNRLLDGIDVDALIQDQNNFGYSSFSNYDRMNYKNMMKILGDNSVILWSEPYSETLFTLNNKKKEFLSIKKSQNIKKVKPFVFVEQQIISKKQINISVIVTYFEKKTRTIYTYSFTKEKQWRINSMNKKEL